MTERALVEGRVRARMFAKGLLSALAHDLELDVPIAESTIEQLDDGTWSGRLTVSIDAIRVVGVLRRGGVATDVLSAGDRAEIEKRAREAFAPEKSFVVTAKGRPTEAGKVDRPELQVTLGNKGNSALRTELVTLAAKGDGFEVRAEGSVSMRALGLPEIKGPLGAFSMKDDVRLEVVLTLR